MSKVLGVQKVITFVVLIFAIIIGILCAFAWRNNQQLNFQAYSPSFLPTGIHVVGHSTDNVTGEGENFKEVTINTSFSHFGIGEEKSTSQGYEMTTFSCKAKLTNSTCTNFTSSKGQKYDVQTAFDTKSMNVTAQNISWYFNGTRFWITLNSDLSRKFATQSWGQIIDSFRPTSYGNEPGKNIHFTGG